MGVNWSLAMPVQTVDEGLYAEDLSRKDQPQLLA
jgi:hypothetical protein